MNIRIRQSFSEAYALPLTKLRGNRLVLATLLLVLFATGSQVACNGDTAGPTAPPVPTLEVRDTVQGVNYSLLITPINEDRDYPRAGEVLFDGTSVWAGPIGPPTICCSSFYYYSYSTPANVTSQSEVPITAGSHVLGFRVTDQRRSPTGYLISGWVDVRYRRERGTVSVTTVSRRVLYFQDVQARLRTGETWSMPFDVPQSGG